jgi:aryl-alcohol dehydrogenase-like predicted oxidoreductase
MEYRKLGRSGIKVSPLGLGTARLAGLGWHEEFAPQDPTQAKRDAVRQIQAAVDLGVTFFDTADNYGQGFSERILGEALRGRRYGIVVATKFGEDPKPDQEDPWSLEAGSVERACAASLHRLEVECIDLYLLHRRDYPLERASALRETLEDLVRAGKIRYYGWSTDDVERARLFAQGEHCIAIEHRLNVFNDHAAMLDLCQEQDLASLNRVPLLMGVLTGRWSPETKLEQGDPRSQWFDQEEFLMLLNCAQQIAPYLTCNGRSYVQGALGWIWARSPLAIPLPGFRNLEQMQALVQAQQFGPLPVEAMQDIEERMISLGNPGHVRG